MSDKSDSIASKKCVTHEFRLSFPALFKAKAFDENQAAKFSAVMLFPKSTDLGKPANGQKVSMKAAAKYALEEKWGTHKAKWPKVLKSPFRDGNDRAGTKGYEDTIFVTATSKDQPGIVGPNLEPVLRESDIYAGCWCRAEVIAYAYDTKGNRGVGFALQNIQKLRDDSKFSGRRDASEVFDAVESTADNPDSYESSADGMGF